MASALTDFCEQVNPNVLSEVRREKFLGGSRVQESFLAGIEKRTLLALAERAPAWVNSDHLTTLGLFGPLWQACSYALAAVDRRWLLAVIACLGLNWFGDSLDGTLARVRNRQRPRYGFYVDHMVDSLWCGRTHGWLALSGYMHPYIAMGLLVAFLVRPFTYLATPTRSANFNFHSGSSGPPSCAFCSPSAISRYSAGLMFSRNTIACLISAELSASSG